MIKLYRLLDSINARADFPHSGSVPMIEVPYHRLDQFVRLGAHRPFEAFINGVEHLIQPHIILQRSEGERVFDVARPVLLDVFGRSEGISHTHKLAPRPDGYLHKFGQGEFQDELRFGHQGAIAVAAIALLYVQRRIVEMQGQHDLFLLDVQFCAIGVDLGL